jgi:hypothetical protein
VSDGTEYAWPNKAHDLRALGDDSYTHAMLAWQRDKGLLSRLLGYRRSAEMLAERVVADADNKDLDTVIFPFAALWRHYVELQLKSLVLNYRFLLNKPYEQRRSHKVLQLWQELRVLIAEDGHSVTGEDVRSVDRVMTQLHDLDPGSEDFRYAHRKDGSATMQDVQALDYVRFHEAMTAVANFLEAVDTGLDVAIEAKLDYEAERQADYAEMMRDLASYDSGTW